MMIRLFDLLTDNIVLLILIVLALDIPVVGCC